MIIAIERSKFNYLYKYNEISVDTVHVGDIEASELSKADLASESLISDFSQILPYFEEDHEVILLDVDKSKIRQGDRCLIYFNAVLSIYPLTTLASKLLEGRLNPKFRIKPPVFEHIVEAVKLRRSLHTRLETIKVLCQYFGLAVDVHEIAPAFLYQVAKNVISQKKEVNYFEHLLAYNKTPSYVPEGNVEYLCKIGIIAMRSLGQNEDGIVKGPFYKACVANKVSINRGDLFQSYKTAIQLPDDNFQQSFRKIVETISKSTPEVDVFGISYFFIAFRSILIENEKDLEKIERDIKRLAEENNDSAKWVVALLGFAFSFEALYESIHLLNRAPLFKDQLRYKDRPEYVDITAGPKVGAIQVVLKEPTSTAEVQAEEKPSALSDQTDEIRKKQQKAEGSFSSKAIEASQDSSVHDVPPTVKLKKLVLFQRIRNMLEKEDAKAWVKHLEKKFKDFDELSWEEVKSSIGRSRAKPLTKESNQNHIKAFFDA